MALDKKHKKNDGPLSGKLVIDASQGIAGPYCGALLAGYGARVIKIDPPAGDWGRNVGTRYDTLSIYAVAYNRGKESVVLDLKKPDDLQILYDLVAEADIFLESSRPGIADKIGIGFETLKQKNDKLIYLSVSGFGQKGAYAARPCTDGVAQAFSGLVDGNVGLDGLPHKIDLPFVDITTGLYSFQSITMALFEVARTGQAQYLDNSLVLSALELQKAKLMEQHLNGGTVAKLNIPSGIYQAADRNVAIALATEAHFDRLLDTFNLTHLKENPKFKTFDTLAENEDEIRSIVQEIVGKKTAAEWEEILGAAGIIVNGINTIDNVLKDPVVKEAGMLRDVHQTGVGEMLMPVLPMMQGNEGDAPTLGEHTDMIKAELKKA
jgi:crotonobetainyl-CoA:carnitine CoA-transferase CaiB-like acyl-CoA transferase